MVYRPTPWFPALIVALVIHWLLLQLSLPEKTPSTPKEEPIVVESWDEDRDRPVVQTEEAKKSEESDEPAEFAGEFKQRVKKQTKAPRTGPLTSSRRLRGGKSKDDSRAEEDGEVAGGSEGPELKDLLVFGARPNALRDEIANGPQTLLNTDPVLYASFINRIADEIYDPWVQLAKQAARRVYVEGSELATKTYITRLTVVVNRKGEVLSVSTLEGSGVRALDDAPKKAFWQSEPFPNPPEQMFGEEDLARFVYEFHFQWKNSAFNIVPLI